MSTAIAKKDGRIDTLEGWFKAAKPRIMAVLPKHMDADKVIRIAMVACTSSPQLMDCTPVSIIRSVMLASQLGLEPSGALGSAYLVPYSNKGRMEAQLIPGYRGLVDLAIRSGKVSRIEAHVVYDCDDFDFALGTASFIKHKPLLDQPDGAKKIAAYAVATMKDGGFQFCILSASDVTRIRSASRSSGNSSSPWVTWPDEMWKKSAVRRLAKMLPLSPELLNIAVAVEDRAEGGEDQLTGILDVFPEDIDPESAPKTSADTLRAKLGASKAPAQASIVEYEPEPGEGG